MLVLPTWGLALLGKQVIFPPFLRSNLLNLFICLSFIFRNLSSITLSIYCWHFPMVEVDTIDASCDLLNSLCLVLSPRILLMDLNRHIGKFNLPYIWDRVLLNTPGLTLKRHVQAVGHANSNTSLLTKLTYPHT